MKLNVSEDVTSMNLNDVEAIALLQIIIKGDKQTRITLKTVKTEQFFKYPFCHPFKSSSNSVHPYLLLYKVCY